MEFIQINCNAEFMKDIINIAQTVDMKFIPARR